jgi:hypothetical protein
LEILERPVYLADSGTYTKSLMVATLYQRPTPQLVLTREILMPNATDVIVSYTVIPGSTLEEWKRNMAEASLMIWKPLRAPKSGPAKNYKNSKIGIEVK